MQLRINRFNLGFSSISKPLTTLFFSSAATGTATKPDSMFAVVPHETVTIRSREFTTHEKVQHCLCTTVDQAQSDSSTKNTTNTQNDKTDDISGSKAQLVQEEEREKGRVALAAGSALCILARGLILATVAYKAATILFHKMHLSIFQSPMSFFDSTPSGRILNRASTDQSAVDMQIPYQVGSFVFAIIQLLGIIAVMSQCAWQVIIVFIPVAGMCIWLQQYYLPSAREMARLGGVCKGPVIQNFSETISGSTTIRSFDQQSRFQDMNLKLNDDFARPKFHAAAAMEWLGIRLDMLSSFTFAAFLIFLISIPEGTIDPSIAGLAVTYGLTLNTLQGWVVWTLTNLENKIISVERIFQYSSIPSEPPLVIESNRPDDKWPSQGEVDVHHLQVRYAPHMPLVLRGLTCTFIRGKKTGIVGRTGSVKSTLIQTLFRLVQPAARQILIDGLNISTIGLHDLRSRLRIIPQDPTMFEGTIRSNLDPLEEYTDDKIWEVAKLHDNEFYDFKHHTVLYGVFGVAYWIASVNMERDDDTPPPGGGGDSNTSEASKLIYGDELYLHPNDSSITNFINIKLKGTENYQHWSCAMTLALSTKKKFGFINGKCKKPSEKSLANQWELCNSVVLSWILGSISQDLYLGQCFSTSPQNVWEELKETYDKLNGIETFNLHHQINSLKQNGTHVSDYYHTLNGLWRQFDSMAKLPACSCDAQKAFKTHSDLIKLMQFLMGLDDVYQPIRSSLLRRDPIPDLKTAFSIISREESHRGSSSSSSGNKPQVSVFTARGPNNNNYNKKNQTNKNTNVVCTNPNCGLPGHSIEKCYKITDKGWIIDFGANQHMVTSLDNLENIVDISDLNLQIDHPNGTTAFIKKVGNLKLSDTITFYDVLYVLEYSVNLLSVHKLARDSKVLGHPSDQALKALKHKIDVRGKGTTAPCDICHHAKQTREPFPISEHSTTNVGEVVHLDVWGPYKVAKTESKDGTDGSSSMEGTERDASGDESLGSPSEATNEESTHASHEDNSGITFHF
ncbi:multidrug resistance-associated protein 3 [Tanacetum coccineum]